MAEAKVDAVLRNRGWRIAVLRGKRVEDIYPIGKFSKWERLLRAVAYVHRHMYRQLLSQ